MNKISMILSAITIGAMIIFIAPNIVALNREHALRNVALWLAIFAGLGVVYQNFGPGSPHPLFSTPYSQATIEPVLNVPAPAPADKTDDEKHSDAEGFTPPKE